MAATEEPATHTPDGDGDTTSTRRATGAWLLVTVVMSVFATLFVTALAVYAWQSGWLGATGGS